jgi:2-keto-4-pentenoate hydratase/2-oxohepta-3-ene-1,7-dioic acid hydratase in catechol pathway
MRLATITYDERPVTALVEGDRVRPINDGSSIRDRAAAGMAGIDRVRAWVAEQADDWSLPLADVELLAAMSDPGAIYTIGLNYRTGDEPDSPPPRPLVYGKLPSSVAAHGATLRWDRALTPNVDAEVELGVVLGVDGGIFGYTIVNDVSARDLQSQHQQFFKGKSLDRSCPIGPWIVTADEIPDPVALGLRLRLNGETRQDSTIADLIFDIPTTLAVLSLGQTVEPGTIVSTGTPSGVGMGRNPPAYMRAGDVMEAEIDRIGVLRNAVVAGG